MDKKTLAALVLITILGMVGIFTINYSRYQKALNLLPPLPGKDLVIKRCTPCHTVDMFVAVKKDRSEWQQALLWMQKIQGMAPLSAEEEGPILDYLTQALPAPKLVK